MVSKKKRRSKARRAAKAAKEAAAVDESRQPDDDLELIGPPQQLALEEKAGKEDNEKADGDNEEEVVGDNDERQLTSEQEIEKILMIDEATGQAMLAFTLGISLDGRYIPVDKNWTGNRLEEESLEMIDKRNSAAEICNHGCHLPGESICQEFVETFDAAFMACRDAGEREVFSLFKAGVDATFIKYAHVWKDSKRMEWARSFYLSKGTRTVLGVGSDNRHAFMFSIVAYFFAQYCNDTEKRRLCRTGHYSRTIC